MTLSQTEEQILSGLIQGATLKSHRYLDGTKVYKLHPLAGPAVELAWATVERLKKQRLIDSNKKFPAATYLLTAKGKQVAQHLITADQTEPLSASNYLSE